MTISRRLRFEILRRDNYTCRYCGASLTNSPDVVLEIDHVLPVSLGGDDDPRNLTVACVDCNAGKSSIPPNAELVADVDATALLFAKAVERAAAIQRAKHADTDAADAAVTEAFKADWDRYQNHAGERIEMPPNWRRAVIRYADATLNQDDFARAVAIAMRAKVDADSVFRYFCGVCNRVLAERQELARRLIEDGDV